MSPASRLLAAQKLLRARNTTDVTHRTAKQREQKQCTHSSAGAVPKYAGIMPDSWLLDTYQDWREARQAKLAGSSPVNVFELTSNVTRLHTHAQAG